MYGCSTRYDVLGGLLQGSVFCLIAIYFNNMPIQVNSSVLQFADAFKMFRVIHDTQDFQQLQ